MMSFKKLAECILKIAATLQRMLSASPQKSTLTLGKRGNRAKPLKKGCILFGVGGEEGGCWCWTSSSG